jgi:hypothetical protein
MSVIKHAADELGIQITRKNGKSTVIARVEAVNVCRKLWQELGLGLSHGILHGESLDDRNRKMVVYTEIASILCGDDVPEFEILT